MVNDGGACILNPGNRNWYIQDIRRVTSMLLQNSSSWKANKINSLFSLHSHGYSFETSCLFNSAILHLLSHFPRILLLIFFRVIINKDVAVCVVLVSFSSAGYLPSFKFLLLNSFYGCSLILSVCRFKCLSHSSVHGSCLINLFNQHRIIMPELVFLRIYFLRGLSISSLMHIMEGFTFYTFLRFQIIFGLITEWVCCFPFFSLTPLTIRFISNFRPLFI